MPPGSPASRWRFLVDENLPERLTGQSRAEGYTAEHVYEVGLRTRPDAEVYAYALSVRATLAAVLLVLRLLPGLAHRLRGTLVPRSNSERKIARNSILPARECRRAWYQMCRRITPPRPPEMPP